MINKMIEEAKRAREKAYIPYSHFAVGAAVLLKSGEIISGCNVENASYGLCNCAERTALFTAYAKGVRKEDIVAMCIIGDTKAPISPCGACRQVMNELLLKNTPIYMTNLSGEVKVMTIGELLPFSFDEVEA